ncbi:MAG: acyl-CoA reductase [Lachnospiraceae bacterium]|nr:acyl-CoA reductase [Lachnospiraceae bacterium]
MILFDGRLMPDEELEKVLSGLEAHCIDTVSKRESVAEMAVMVMNACGVMEERIRTGVYDDILNPLLQRGVFTEAQLAEALEYFDHENMVAKYWTELGVLMDHMPEYNDKGVRITRRMEPLGVLFHIAAGNAQGLPFYSVIEGMMAGNVNILKLPSADDGLSVMLLHKLIQIEPKLAPYVCVLDVPSTNVEVMKRLAGMADAVVVWGGDEAVRAVRTMADTNTQIISWGHKLSFAYVTEAATDEELKELAKHICATRQVLCNSCQGLFVDTQDDAKVLAMGQRFLQILQEVAGEYPEESIGVRGKVSLSLYNEELESKDSGRKVLRGKGVSVTVMPDEKLELSFMFKNCWAKPLPRAHIVKALKGHRGHLQTVGLLCAEEERAELTDLLVKAGVTHVTRAGRMAHTVAGATHDGEYPLRRYVRVVDVEL